MERYPEPADRNEAYAETAQERLGVRDEDWLTAATDENNRRADTTAEEAQDDVPAPEDLEPEEPEPEHPGTDTARRAGDR
ncbi:hypothetical protein [Kocuria sp. NPDC057446]|uniref:hypothetical protein n=1 Tax=Kocuria sp. NPDC057446 TaxID=3346137 RepID=UPI003682FD8F